MAQKISRKKRKYKLTKQGKLIIRCSVFMIAATVAAIIFEAVNGVEKSSSVPAVSKSVAVSNEEQTEPQTETQAATEHSIETQNGATYIDGILIVNKSYPLSEDYAPGGLTDETKAAFDEMAVSAKSDGIDLWICSGYRSYADQKSLYESYVNRDGTEAADSYSSRPGYSEHQTGLALDVNDASDSFDGTEEAKWLAEHCAEYGFIIRFPNGKESATGYEYEPWHIRYLGKETAQDVTASGLSLEEYLGITSEYKN